MLDTIDTLPGAQARVFPDKHAVAVAAADLILEQAADAIARQGRFKLVLAGGTTPTEAYRLLAQRQAHWPAWEIYHGDERCLPVDDPQRNSLVADHAWLDRVAIPSAQNHAIPAELGPEAAAHAYESEVQAAVPFDLVLLGMGEDGHTASLFPGHSIASTALVMPVHGAPKPPPRRVSLTPHALCATARLLMIITGAGKREALQRWADGEDLPIAGVADGAPTLVFLDQAAASGV